MRSAMFKGSQKASEPDNQLSLRFESVFTHQHLSQIVKRDLQFCDQSNMALNRKMTICSSQLEVHKLANNFFFHRKHMLFQRPLKIGTTTLKSKWI